MKRTAILVYGTTCYAIFFATFLYAIGFVGNFVVPKSIDTGIATAWPLAVAINGALLGVFALQHSVMARPVVKHWITRFIPQPVERSSYVLASSVAMLLLFWAWRPLPATVFSIDDQVLRTAMTGVFLGGVLLVLYSTFLIDHFDLFGMRQVVLYFQKKPYVPLEFKSRLFYEVVRHPLMVGWIVAFWATPHMTVGHLVFAVTTTLYILVAIKIEEGDLMKYHGEDYAAYRRRVPMLVPFTKGRTSAPKPSSGQVS